jgi:hypothetical protein
MHHGIYIDPGRLPHRQSITSPSLRLRWGFVSNLFNDLIALNESPPDDLIWLMIDGLLAKEEQP